MRCVEVGELGTVFPDSTSPTATGTKIMLRKLLLSLFVTAALIATSACSTSPTGRPQVLIGSKRDLDAQGRWAFREFKKEAPSVTHGPTIDYVTCVTNNILDQIPEKEFNARDWELLIVDVPQTNAFVWPGGKIVVYTGIFQAARNQHQLAAVLGHEVAHEIANHPLERQSNQKVSQYGVAVAGAVVAGGAPSYNAARATYTALGYAAQLGFMLPFSRAHEAEADVVGLRYMANAGFDPRESIPLWKNMASGNKELPPELLMTHPAPDTRIENLIGQLETTLPLYNDAKARGLNPDCQTPEYLLVPAEKETSGEESMLEPGSEKELNEADTAP